MVIPALPRCTLSSEARARQPPQPRVRRAFGQGIVRAIDVPWPRCVTARGKRLQSSRLRLRRCTGANPQSGPRGAGDPISGSRALRLRLGVRYANADPDGQRLHRCAPAPHRPATCRLDATTATAIARRTGRRPNPGPPPAKGRTADRIPHRRRRVRRCRPPGRGPPRVIYRHVVQHVMMVVVGNLRRGPRTGTLGAVHDRCFSIIGARGGM